MGVFLLCATGPSEAAGRVLIGHTGGNQVAALYRASESPSWDEEFEALKFGSSADVGYALLSGSIDAGFVDIVKVRNMREFPGFERLTALGRVTFPYGATLVLRRGLNLRLGELKGTRIAISSPECVLFEAFREDADRLKADITGVEYVVMPFDTMIPALEAGEADAAVIKGAAAVAALSQGHTILYQNWDVQPGDECCPAIVDQAVQVLLVRRDLGKRAEVLAELLLRAESEGPEELRGAVARHTTITPDLLEGQPVPEFNRADDSLLAVLAEFLDEDGNRVDPDED
jgi:ABC-type nitrate/sulfonate/bicarbonate transport system substrate-binding protein